MPTQRLHYEHFEILTNDDGSLVKLGRGGMGTTYKAFDTRRRKHVALKTIGEKLLADPTSRRRFFNEARAASNLDHPNVVRVDYVCSDDAAECFYAMEWVDGESLGERVKKSGALPPREALLLLRAVADALTVLGEQRLVHRDIKPDNIMIARAGRAGSRVKLIDFGLAKALEYAPDRFASVDTGERFVGSVYFASPEQIHAREELDCRSDFYSLGATLWWVLTASPPFTGSTFHVQKGHVESEPPWEKIAQFPACIQTLLRCLLAKDPAQRPPDAEALLADWDAVLADLEPASPQRPRDEAQSAGDSQPHPIVAPAEPVVAVNVDQAPPGCDAPPPHAWLARDAASGDWFAVRRVPPTLAAESRAELLDAARAAQTAQHSGLLNVRDVRDEEIISEWPPSIAATRLLAVQQGALPLAVVLAWLPKLATTIDWACQHGLSRLGLDPAHWLIAFETLSENETPSERAALAPSEWGPHYVFLDPLAGFDPDLAAAATMPDDTVVAQPATTLNTPAEYLAALACALYEMHGGRDLQRLSPLPTLDPQSNEMLFAAVCGQAEFDSVSEWAAAFVRSAAADHMPARADHSEATETPATPPSLSPPLLSKRRVKAWLAAAALVIVLVLANVWVQMQPVPDPIPALLAEAGAAVAAHDVSLAEEKIAAAETSASGDLRVTTLRAELEKEKQRLASEAQRKLETATKAVPFENSLKMKFVRVFNEGEPTDGIRVLFCIWDTRVKDFAAFVDATGYNATAGMFSLEIASDGKGFNWNQAERTWKRPGFAQTDEHPVVGVSWEDAQAFCAWLTKTEHASGKLPERFSYRLPNDKEWSAAAGETEYPWGDEWPPPKGAGNYAGEESKAGTPVNWGFIAGYDDGFSRTSPVGRFKENKFGLYDMGGNVWQWCEDWYRKDMNSSDVWKKTLPLFGEDGGGQKFRVLRGASWGVSIGLRSANRFVGPPGRRGNDRGFRCVVAPSAR